VNCSVLPAGTDGLTGVTWIDTRTTAALIVNAELAEPTLPAASVALTVNVCGPTASGLGTVNGEVHEINAPVSTLHCVAPIAPVVVKPKVGIGLVDPAGGTEVKVTAGGVRSTTNPRLADPTFPAASLPMTFSVCDPSTRVPAAYGDVQGTFGLPSMLHWNVTAVPGALTSAKVKLGRGLLVSVTFGGTGMLITGLGVSTANAKVAVGPLLPTESFA
jgi:hypothetical protein